MKLLEPYNLGGLQLPNRVVMAPLTRSRAKDDIADEMTAAYYAQRATAGLIISEGTPISREGQGYVSIPGIYSAAQIAGWRKSTDAVHRAGGRIFAQLWHVGRVSHTSMQPSGAAPVSASSLVARGALAYGYDASGNPDFVPTSVPHQLSTDEVARLISDFVAAAANAIEAGFDGVELHGANGYIFEQFLHPSVNDRSDQYSAATLANRLRFLLETVDAIAARIGPSRVGVRFSPFGNLFDMPPYPGAEETYLELGRALAERKIAYIHLMDQSGFKLGDAVLPANAQFPRLLERLREAFHTGAIIVAGGLTRDRANQLIDDGVIDLAAFGEPFIANPDLVARFEHGWTLAIADRATFYGGGAAGYVDYPAYGAAPTS